MGPGSRARPGRRSFGLREAPTCGCTKSPQGQFHCFRIVIYNDFYNSDVSAASRAQDFCKATRSQTCRLSRRHIRTPHSSRFAVASRRVLARLLRGHANRAGEMQGCSSSDSRGQFASHPRSLARSLRPGCAVIAIIKTVARSKIALRPGAWLRLSRPTQSLMTLA